MISFHALHSIHPIQTLSRGLHALFHPYSIENKTAAERHAVSLHLKRRAQRLSVTTKTTLS